MRVKRSGASGAVCTRSVGRRPHVLCGAVSVDVASQYRTVPGLQRLKNTSNKKYYTQKKAVEKVFDKLFMSPNIGGF